MVNDALMSRISEFGIKKDDLRVEADSLTVELGNAIVERLLVLFDERDNKGQSFEAWLTRQFNTDSYVAWDIFTKDSELSILMRGVDATQGLFASRLKVANVVNARLLEIPSTIGVNKSFVDVAGIGI